MTLLISLALSCIGIQEPEQTKRIHIPIETSFEDYRKLLKESDARESRNPRQAPDPLDEVIAWGVRMEEWYRQIETPNLRKVRTPGTAPSMDKPWRYGTASILDDFESFKAKWDPKVKAVLESREDFPAELPVQRSSLDWYHSRIAYISSVAIRWQFHKRHRATLVAAANQDVRGYTFLKREPNLRFDLLMWNGQPEARKKDLQFWLLNQCRNATKDPLGCAVEFKKEIIDQNNPLRLYDLYKNAALENYQTFLESKILIPILFSKLKPLTIPYFNFCNPPTLTRQTGLSKPSANTIILVVGISCPNTETQRF